MPEKNGFLFVLEPKKHVEWRSTPTFVVTAQLLAREDRLCLNVHVERIMQKGEYCRKDLLKNVRDRVFVRRICIT